MVILATIIGDALPLLSCRLSGNVTQCVKDREE